MFAAVGEEGIAMEHPSLSVSATDQPGVALADSEQATLATTLAMLAHGSNAGYMLAQLQENAPAECAQSSDGRQLLAKRDGTTAGLSNHRDSKQPRHADAEPLGTPPDSPLSATAAAAAAAGLHKLSSASAVEFDAALRPFVVSEDGVQHVSHPHSNELDQTAVAGAGNPKSTPIQIMQQLVDCGILPSCGPETHCYVKCGMVQGVFSLASGTILCLCDACSESGQGEPTWFPPAAFERHGGMAASKKWRGSIQVKGLPQRKTLGQWLDERGVTAKPRLTLADQVQQAGGSRQRTGNHVAPGRVTSGSELATAAANAARLAGLGRTAAGSGGPRAPVSQENGLIIPAAAMDVDGLEVYSSAGMPQIEPTAVVSAGLPQFETYSQPQVYVPIPIETLPPLSPPPPAVAPASEQPGHPNSGWVAKLKHLLEELAAAEGPAASTAAASVVQAPEAMHQQEAVHQQQQPQVTLLQQLQQLRREQQQHPAAGLAPAAPAVPAPAAPAEDPLIRLARLLPGVLPACAIGPAGMSEPSVSALVAAPAVSAHPTSPTTTAQVVSPAIQPELVPQASALAAAVASPPPGPAVSAGAEGQQSINLLLMLATAKAVTEPMESFKLLSQALQQLLRQHGDTCKEAAAAASAAVAAAGEKVCGKNDNGSTVSAAAAFAAIAAAAAAAAAALAGQCQQQAAVQPTVEQPAQSQVQRQELAVIAPRFHQEQLQHSHEPVALQHVPDQNATTAAVAAVQEILAARGVAARSVAQLMAGMLAGQDPEPLHHPVQVQQGPSDAYNTLLSAFVREFGGAVVVGR